MLPDLSPLWERSGDEATPDVAGHGHMIYDIPEQGAMEKCMGEAVLFSAHSLSLGHLEMKLHRRMDITA